MRGFADYGERSVAWTNLNENPHKDGDEPLRADHIMSGRLCIAIIEINQD